MFHGYARTQNTACFPYWIKTHGKFSLAVWLGLTKWSPLTTLQAASTTPPSRQGQRTIKPKSRKNTVLSVHSWDLWLQHLGCVKQRWQCEAWEHLLPLLLQTTAFRMTPEGRHAHCWSQNNADGSSSEGSQGGKLFGGGNEKRHRSKNEQDIRINTCKNGIMESIIWYTSTNGSGSWLVIKWL